MLCDIPQHHLLLSPAHLPLQQARNMPATSQMQMLKPGASTTRFSSRLSCRCYAGIIGSRPSPAHQQRRQLQPSSISAAAAAPCVPARHRHHTQQQQQQQLGRQFSRVVPHAEPDNSNNSEVVYNKEFGYSRKDVLIIIVGLIGLGVVMYEGLQATGMDAGMAGNFVQATIFLGICVGWVSTYLWRVANKKMTYAQQLQMYESAVMQKRLEEMTEAELQQLMAEVESDKARLAATKEALSRQQQRSSSSGGTQ